jgi:hypothetical protein
VTHTPGTVAPPVAGSYSIRLEDAQGTALATHTFKPVIGSDNFATAAVSLQLPWETGTKRIVLLRNGQVLDSRLASPNSPTVTVTSPNGGETFSGPTNVAWTANDLDGDVLKYAIEYSTDNGATWIALSMNWNSTVFPVDFSKLPASNQALVRVRASDGFNSGEDRSNAVFTVPPHAPMAYISAPTNNQIYVGDQTIVLNGVSMDIEDGFLAGSRVSWSSNLNGPLGTGNSVGVNAATLQEGTHIITLTATDNSSQTSSVSVSIKVFRTRPSFPAALSVGPTGLTFAAGVGTGQSAPQVLAIRNDGDGDLTWSATADRPWIQLVSTTGTAPSNAEVNINPAGLVAGNYQGTITITGNGANSPQTVTVNLAVLPPSTVSGRVLTPNGLGLRNAAVSLITSEGTRRTATTSSFGLFSFGDVPSGSTYTISISSKRYRFAPRIVQVNGNLTLPDFVGLE